MNNQCDHGQLARTCLLCEMRDENLALRAKLADCQAVIRHKGHDKRCPANLCHFCGAAPEWKAHDDGSVGHAFIPRGPCSDACGHDRTTGEKA